MKLPANSIIEGVVSSDDTRYVLNHVWLDVEKKRAIATDGRMLAILPVEVDEHDTSGPITVEAVKAARKLSGKRMLPSVVANGKLTLTNGTSFPRPNSLTYPTVDQVIPAADRPVCFKVALDAELLHRLAKALSNGSNTFVTLEFESPTETIKVTGSNTEGVGVLMPAKLKP